MTNRLLRQKPSRFTEKARSVKDVLHLLWLAWLAIMIQGQVVEAAPPDLEPAPSGSFTVAVIPDTQRYVVQTKANSLDGGLRNVVFDSITKWIVENRDRQNIVFASHVGDIVDRNIPHQWTVARRCMDTLHGVVPYGISVGNHDMVRSGDSSLFQSYFAESRFKGFAWYGGSFQPQRDKPNISGNNANSFQRFTAGKLQFLILHLECNAPDDVLQWANQTIESHPTHRVLVTTHMDLGPLQAPKTAEGFIKDPKGRMQWKKCHSKRGNTPVQMWDKCFKKHKNLFMICSGDQSRTQAKHLTERGAHGNLVHSCLSDYGSDGSLRLYRFTPSKNLVQAITYNVRKNALTRSTSLYPQESAHQFSFEYAMSN